MKILVVDDEPDLLEQLRETLMSQKYDVDTADEGESALDKLFDKEYDLVILDIMLPKVDGLEILREIRKAKIATPVIMLTAKGAVEDKIKGLDYGADDYLQKPFAIAELMARIRSLLRRTSDNRDLILTVSDVSLNTKTRQAKKKNITVELTPKEFSILEFLLYNKNRAVSRFTLAEHVWGDEFDPFTMSNFIDVHIKNLRRKIGDTDKKKIISTIRGIGFIIEDEQDEDTL
jgi:DNA-binding response OmpR family regulator